METFVLWYFGIGGIIAISSGIWICWICKDIEIDDSTDFVLGMGLICLFIGWPTIFLFSFVELIKLIVCLIRKFLNSGKSLATKNN